MSIAEHGAGQGSSIRAGTPSATNTLQPSDGTYAVQTCDELPRPGVSEYAAIPKGLNLRLPEGWTATVAQTVDAQGTLTVDATPEQTPKPVKKIAIVGKAPSSLGLAPYMDPTVSIWGLSDGWKNMPRPANANDVWFELHDVDTGRKKRWPPDYFEWLKQHQDKLPLYLGHKLRVNKYAIAEMTLNEARQLDRETKLHKDLPHARAYPVYEVLWRFGTYFNNSISFMMAMAALQGVTHVGVYGVDMAQSDPVNGQNGEYEHQRPSCEYMVGTLRGMGIQVHVPGEADLLKCKRLYAFESHGNEDEEEKKRIARLAELNAGVQKHEQQMMACQQRVIALKGALDQMNYDYRRSR